MAITPQIAYRDVMQSDALDSLVIRETAKLQRHYARIISCRVLIERRRHRTGAPFQARIVISVPGEDIIVNQGPDTHDALLHDDANELPLRVKKGTENIDAAYKDPVLAVRSAFRKAERRLAAYAKAKAEPSPYRKST